jgi:outer membrane lipoprotein-sorting protein
LKKVLLYLLWVPFLFSPGLLLAQEEGARTLDDLQKKYSNLKDYTVDVNVHFDVEGFKAPDMQAKLYCKPPDRMKIESKRIFFLPKEGGTFNPFMFNKEDFEVKFLERLTYDGRNAVKLKLTPQKRKLNAQDFILTVDTDRHLIREMNTSSSDGREVKVLIEYGHFSDFDLPTRIELHLNVQFSESMEIRDFGPSAQPARRVTGRVDITYSNYKVNSGLSDQIFDKTGSPQSRGRSSKETD